MLNRFNGIFEHIVLIFIDMAPYLVLGLFFVGILHILFSKDFVLKHIGKDNIASVVKASILGVPLPLCSCGVIPTAVFMSKNGASKGAVISFLISTPQTGIDSIMATYGMMGWIFAIYRPIVAFISGIIGGIIVNIFTKEADVDISNEDLSHAEAICSSDSCCSSEDNTTTVIEENNENIKIYAKLKMGYNYAFVEFLDDITMHFIVGIIISGLISYFLPIDFLKTYNLDSGLIAMLMMVIIGIPMYICATASIPIAITLMLKGLSPGAALVFLSVGPLTNAASLSILYKVFSKKILFIYLSVSSVLAVLFGYLLDVSINYFDFNVSEMISMNHEHTNPATEVIYNIFSIYLLFALGMSLYRRKFRKYFVKTKKKKNLKITNLEIKNYIKAEKSLSEDTDKKDKGSQMSESINELQFEVDGMSCNHCVNNVKNGVNKLAGVEKIKVDLSTKEVLISGSNLNKDQIAKTINGLGYKVL